MYLPRSLFSHLYTQLVRSHHPLSPPVLLLVSLDPDAICACRILTALLKRDYIPHKIQPVSGYADLSKAAEDLVRPMKSSEGGSGGVVICLGVGAMVDLASMVGSEDEDTQMGGIELWVLDARRPWNLDNVFGQAQTLPLQETVPNASRRTPGVERGLIQRGYKPGKGGVIVFDDGDIADDLHAEKHAYFELAEMPEVDDDEIDEENDEDDQPSKKRKSWSDRENEEPDTDDERPRQRRRSNSGSSIASSQNRTPPSSQPSSSPSKLQSPKQPTAKQLRKKLLDMRRTHEAVLEQYYSIGTSHSEPISALAYSLASELGREDNHLLWLAIIGVTSLELSGQTSTGLGTKQTTSNIPHEYHKSWKTNRSSRTYALLRDEVRRLNPPQLDSPSISPTYGASSSPSDTSIRLSPDPRFLLLRHWSLYESMLHSPYVATRLQVWNEFGTRRLHKLLARMGVSLSQCKQTYTHMDMDLKKTLRERLLKEASKYRIDDVVPPGNGLATYEQEGWGFIRSWGWKAQLSAVDVGVILGAILDVGVGPPTLPSSSSNYNNSSQRSTIESLPDRSEALVPRFFAAYDALAPNHPTQLLASIPTAQHLLRAILRTGSSLLAKRQIRHLRAFKMAVVKEGPDLPLFANSPGALVKLALWLGETLATLDHDTKQTEPPMPFVLAALDEARGTQLVVGIGGGIGSGVDVEARKEKQERREKKLAAKQEKQKVKAAAKAARDAEKAARNLDGDDEEEQESEEDDSEESSDDDDNEDEEEMRSRLSKRGYGHNRFGIAFAEVIAETNARVSIDSFDHCVVEVRKEDLGPFLEGLSFKSVVGR